MRWQELRPLFIAEEGIHEMDQEAATPTTRPAPRRRWLIAVAIVATGLVCHALVNNALSENPTFAKIGSLIVWSSNAFLLLLWWIFLSGWSLRVRLAGCGVLVVILVGLAAVFRLDGTDGNMVPRFAWRWSPTRDEVARQYFQGQNAPAPIASEQPAVAEATDWTIDENDWPGFRGPLRDGIFRAGSIRIDWDENPPKELWRHPVGRGWSSFAVVNGLAFTQEQRDSGEAIVCYDVETGEQVWIHIDDDRFSVTEAQGGDGPRATPQIDGEYLYSLGGTGVLNCLDARTGKRVWSTNILKEAGGEGSTAPNIEWGMAGSPWIEGDLVLVNPGGSEGRSLLAIDKTTGRVQWVAGTYPASYAGVRVEELLGERVVLVYHAQGLTAHSLDGGRELWTVPWQNFAKVNATQPIVVADNTVLFGSGYGMGTVRLAVSRSDDAWSTETVWKTTRLKQKFNDAILWKDHLYGLDDGIMTCVSVDDGSVAWKSGRYGYGQVVLLADQELLLIMTEEGDVLLIPAAPERPKELARFKALEGICWNHPVVSEGRLLVRNGAEAACFDVSLPKTAAAEAEVPENSAE